MIGTVQQAQCTGPICKGSLLVRLGFLVFTQTARFQPTLWEQFYAFLSKIIMLPHTLVLQENGLN